MLRARSQLDAEGVEELEHGVVAGLGAGGECLVETFAAEASVRGELGHSAGLRHVPDGREEDVGVRILEGSADILGNRLLALEVVGRVEGSVSTHAYSLSSFPARAMARLMSRACVDLSPPARRR